MNTRIDLVDEYEVRKYGCCGTFFFMVAIAETRKRLVMSLKTQEEAYAWINSQKEINNSNKNAIFNPEVNNELET